MPLVWLASMSDSCPTRPVAASYPVPPTRRDAVAPLHSQIRIGHDRHLQTAPIGLLFSLGRLITLAKSQTPPRPCQRIAIGLIAEYSPIADRAVSAEQLHARLWANNATRLFG